MLLFSLTMITTRFGTGFLGLLLVWAVIGCTDHRFPTVTPGANRLRVKLITQQVTGTVSMSTASAFSYDGQGRLSSILAYRIPDSVMAPVEITVYQYNPQNQLTQVQHSAVRRGSNSETYTLTYNAAGQLSQLASSSTFSISPQYNAAQQLTGYSKAINVSGLLSSGGGSLTFTGNNLTASSEVFSIFRSGGSPTAPPAYSRSTNTSYTFDDKLNPFYGTYIIPAPGVFLPFAGTTSFFGPFYTFYGGIDNFFNVSRNNVLAAVSSSETILYSYTYNTANLPTSRTTTTSNGVTEILLYEYEAY